MRTELDSSFHPFSQYLVNICSGQGTVLGLRTQSGNQTQQGPFFHGAGILVGTESKDTIRYTRQPQTAVFSAKEKNEMQRVLKWGKIENSNWDGQGGLL